VRIIGIDPGSARAGWGVIEKKAGTCSVVAYGCVETKAGQSDEVRLLQLATELNALIEEHKPEEAAVETLFFHQNQTTAMKVSQARGAILLELARVGLAVNDYTPLQVKMAMVGYGRAEKKQVEEMVMRELGIKEKIRPDDAADALAVAITHAASSRLVKAAK
jgi:crossover junction endodeoxyribonuclease RuvC